MATNDSTIEHVLLWMVSATAFGLLLDIVEKHLDEIPQAKPKGKAKAIEQET